jgi:hypothetical protein
MVGQPCDPFFLLIKRNLKGNFVILRVLTAKIYELVQIDCNRKFEEDLSNRIKFNDLNSNFPF